MLQQLGELLGDISKVDLNHNAENLDRDQHQFGDVVEAPFIESAADIILSAANLIIKSEFIDCKDNVHADVANDGKEIETRFAEIQSEDAPNTDQAKCDRYYESNP